MITWNSHAVCTQISQTQDAASVCDYDDLHIVTGPVLHDLIEAVLMPEG